MNGYLLLFAAGAGLAGCTQTAPRDATHPRHDQAVEALLASADAWNRGDLAGFLAPYQNSGLTSYAGRSGFVQGYDRLRDSYARGYWTGGAPEDSLAFDVVEVRPLGDEAALLLGRYRLISRLDAEVTSTGIFSLVWILTDQGWKITHDHTAETH